MILVDDRVGSRELLGILRGFGVDADLGGRIDADFQFTGNGPEGTVLIGIERKTTQDLFNSMRDRRLAGTQIGKMAAAYDVSYLVVEGIWRRGRESGLVEVRNGNWHPARGNVRYAEVDRFLCSLQELGDIRLWRTADEEETCAAIADRFLWWQKDWDAHRTADSIYAPPPDTRVKRGSRASMFRREATPVEKWMVQLPHIDGRASELAKYFSSAGDMANAPVERWMTIKGIGEKTARRIVDWIWE